MDRKERFDSPEETLRAVIQGHQAELWSALPGVVQSYDPKKKTCTVQPAIQARITNAVTGAHTWVDLPLLLDCPVFFPSGGGCTLTFPITKGDECLVVFSCRCIDEWWVKGGTKNKQITLRMHDLSDGFAFVGVSSNTQVQPQLNTSSVQLRSNDGKSYIELNPKSGDITVSAQGGPGRTATVGITAASSITITSGTRIDIIAPEVGIVGKLSVSGDTDISGRLSNNGVNVGDSHVHGKVKVGTDTSGVPQ